MMKIPGNCWPTQMQMLLLKAGLLDENRARNAWHEYCSKVDLEKADYVSTTLFPMVYRNLKTDERYPRQMQICKSAYCHTWAFNHAMIYECERMLKKLHAAGIEVSLLKGAALIKAYYRDYGARVIGDVDVLIPENSMHVALRLLFEEGWRSPCFDLLSDAHWVYIKRQAWIDLHHKSNAKIDVHWRVLHEPFNDIRCSLFQYRLVEVNPPAYFKVLSSEDLLFHSLLHGVQEAELSLIRWVCDAHIILKLSPNFDWDRFLITVKSMGLMILVKEALLYLHENEFIVLPRGVKQSLVEYKGFLGERIFVHLLTKKRNKFTYPIEMCFCQHLRNSKFNNMVMLLVTFPLFLVTNKRLVGVERRILVIPWLMFKGLRYYFRMLKVGV